MGMLPWKLYVVYTLWRHIIGQGGAIIRPVLTQLLSSGETECDVTRLKHLRNHKRCRNGTCKRARGKVCCFKGISSIFLQSENVTTRSSNLGFQHSKATCSMSRSRPWFPGQPGGWCCPPTLLWGAVISHGPLGHHSVSWSPLTHHAHGRLSLVVLPTGLGWGIVRSGRLLVHHRD